MEYNRPEVVAMGSAIAAVQGCGEKGTGPQDCDPPKRSPAGAYEADE